MPNESRLGPPPPGRQTGEHVCHGHREGEPRQRIGSQALRRYGASLTQMTSGFPWEIKASFFGWLTLKGEPFPKERQKRALLGNWVGLCVRCSLPSELLQHKSPNARPFLLESPLEGPSILGFFRQICRKAPADLLNGGLSKPWVTTIHRGRWGKIPRTHSSRTVDQLYEGVLYEGVSTRFWKCGLWTKASLLGHLP